MAQGNAKKIGLDHGDLVGKDDDDHTQYLNDTRHDEAHEGFFALDVGSTLAISAGLVTATKSFHSIDTQDGDPTDSLNAVTAAPGGTILVLRSVSSSRVITAVDGASNLRLAGNFVFNSPHDTLVLISVGSDWQELSRSDNL